MPFRELIGHERPKATLRAAIAQDRLAHAYLFHGDEGIGKFAMAVALAQTINCEAPPQAAAQESIDACGACRSCNQILARTHPDCLYIEPDPEQATPQIKIDQIREIEQQVLYRPLVGRRKICLINDADRMTLGAANALLKTLEEPPAHSVFLLVTCRPAALPATIRSRCQGVRFAPPPAREVEAALIARRQHAPADARFLTVLSQARIGEALGTDLKQTRARQEEFFTLISARFLKSVITLLTASESLAKSDRALEALDWIARWLRDVVLIQIGAEMDTLLNSDRMAELREAADRLPQDALLDLLDGIERLQRSATRHLNPQLALESVLLGLRDAYTQHA
jgi:DNA polymerase III subunit delta'